MWYVYVLQSLKNERLYTGLTNNLKRKFEEHNKKIGGKYTRENGPFKLIFYEAFLNKKDAEKHELFLKSGYGREVLKKKIGNYLTNK
ncbi:MAG: GIY-YIG nuclease family protein [Patescibacteria group bacterium]|nr:GIY-YIG nuclease family protein [Patescibacteria group bacterium]